MSMVAIFQVPNLNICSGAKWEGTVTYFKQET